MSSRSNDNVICRFGFVLAALALCIACHSTDSSTEAKPEPSLPSAASDPYAAISSYAFGNSREPLSLIEKEIRGASQARLAEIERRFIDLLASDNCTEAGKQFVCRMLRRMGTDASVPALASLLSDETLSDAARFALQGRSSPLADQAFRDALDELGGFLQIGVIHSMAQREDRKVIPALGGLLGSDEPFLVRACLSALGALGGPEAAVFLNRVEVTADLENDLDHARLQCAHSFLEHGDKKAAAELFRSLTLENKTIPVRIAGWQGLCRAEEEKAVPMLVSLLASDDEGLRAAALGFLISFQQNTEVDAALVESLESAGAKARASLIRCITTRRTPGALPILLRCTGDEEKQVRQRAVQGLAALAGAEDLPELVDLMDVMGNEEDLEALKEAILVVISRLPEGDERTRYLQERYGQSVNASRVALLDLLGRMPDENTLSLLNAALLGADLRLKSTAVRALAAWPDATPLNTLLDLARKATDPALRAGAHKGLVNMLDYPSSRTPEETCSLYRSAADLAMDRDELNALIRNASRIREPWVLGFLETFLHDPDMAEAAGQAGALAATALAATATHDALHKPVALAFPCEEKYDGGGANALTDGTGGSTNYGDGCWQGFKEHDLIATIDLNQEIRIREIRASFLQDTKSWIFPPTEVNISLSSDGKYFETAARIIRAVPRGFADPSVDEFHFELKGRSARYIRVHARSVDTCPEWHPGSGSSGWLFCDEIRINPHIRP